MRAVFYIVAFLVAYGSFYPFDFDLAVVDQNRVSALFNFALSRTGLSDMVANILLFVPLGFLFKPTHLHISVGRRAFLFVFYGLIYAFSIQLAQLWMPQRVPWGGDALLNFIGFIVGYGLFSVTRFSRFTHLDSYTQLQKISFMLGLGLIVYKLSPFVPSLDVGNLKDNVKQVFIAPTIDLFWVYENTITWLTGLFLIRQSGIVQLTAQRTIVLVCAILFLKFFIVANTINLDRLVGGALALGLWLTAARFVSATLLLLGLLIAIFGNAFYPFELREFAAAFNWVPFSGSLRGNVLLNILALGKKIILYASLLWLLQQHLKKLATSTLVTAFTLFCSEYLQRFFINSVAEVTDALLALFIGFILAVVLRGRTDMPAAAATAPTTNNKVSLANYIPGLNGLRAFAALSVFVVHFQQFSGVGGNLGVIDFERWMVNGNTGVGLFFALSGFLLSMPFWQRLEQKRAFNIKAYCVNRAVRIIPLYYLCLLALLATKGFSGSEANINNILSHVFFLHNLKDHQVLSLNPPFWTLAVEVQFYFLLPFIFLMLRKVPSKVLAQVIIIVLIGGCVAAYQLLMHSLSSHQNWPIRFPLIWPFGVELTRLDGNALKYSTLAHLPHFMLGMLAASVYLSAKWIKSTLTNEVIFWVCAVCIVAILATPLDTTLQIPYGRYNFPYVPILLTLVVLSAPQTRSAKALLECKPIAMMGMVSYGIYIFHYPIQKLSLRILDKVQVADADSPLVFFILSLLATLTAAFLSYYWFEKPIMGWVKHRVTHSKGESVDTSANTPAHNQTPLQVVLPENKQILGQGQPHIVQNKPSPRYKKYAILTVALISVIGLGSYYYKTVMRLPYSVAQASWAGVGERLIFDHHAHTTYSDGRLSLKELVDEAYFKGCDALTISDHTDKQSSFTPEKLQEIRAIRQTYPGLLVLSALEVGIPSYDQREHVNILAKPEIEQSLLSGIMAALGDIYGTKRSNDDSAIIDAVRRLSGNQESYFGIYNHPSRKDLSAKENTEDLLNWNKDTQLIHALAGAPGHQRKTPIGSYATKFFTQHRWDPAVAKVGGTWDQQLARGNTIWGAIASSDFHSTRLDYYPCEFARIHVAVPTRDYSGLFKGLHAGTFWADHGKLLKDYSLSLSLPESAEKAYPGASVTLPKSEVVLAVNINFVRGDDYLDDYMRFDLITNCNSKQTSADSYFFAPNENARQVFVALPDMKNNCFIRSRIVRETIDNTDNYAAYSNPIMLAFH